MNYRTYEVYDLKDETWPPLLCTKHPSDTFSIHHGGKHGVSIELTREQLNDLVKIIREELKK